MVRSTGKARGFCLMALSAQATDSENLWSHMSAIAIVIEIFHSCGSHGLTRRARARRSLATARLSKLISAHELIVSAMGEFGLIVSDLSKSSFALAWSAARKVIG